MDARPPKSIGNEESSPVYEAVATTPQQSAAPVIVQNNYGTIHGNVMNANTSSLTSSNIPKNNNNNKITLRKKKQIQYHNDEIESEEDEDFEIKQNDYEVSSDEEEKYEKSPNRQKVTKMENEFLSQLDNINNNNKQSQSLQSYEKLLQAMNQKIELPMMKVWYDSWGEFDQELANYEKKNNCALAVKSSNYTTWKNNRIKKKNEEKKSNPRYVPIKLFDESFKFWRKEFICTHGWTPKNNSSRKIERFTNCPMNMSVQLIIVDNENKIKVTKQKMEHNHVINEEKYCNYSKNRVNVDPKVIDYVSFAHKLGAKRKMIYGWIKQQPSGKKLYFTFYLFFIILFILIFLTHIFLFYSFMYFLFQLGYNLNYWIDVLLFY